MSSLTWLALQSLWNRRTTALLTALAIAVSVALLIGVQTLRSEARESFARTISGTDLVVGARSGPINLLLYSVFRIGDATTNVSWQSFQLVSRHPDVAWAVPISLGDSHRGYRVMGTSAAYFEHYRYGRRQALAFSDGQAFDDLHQVVLGAEVARQLGYALGSEITLSHGVGEVSFAEHGDHPFVIAGILAPTGTPVDQALHVSVEAITDLHLATPEDDDHDHELERDLTPGSITAFLVGMRSPDSILQMQRALNEYRAEPLLAILPGVVLQQLWQLVGVADRALFIISAFVVLAGLVGMLTSILTSLRERRREMAILRAVGAGPTHIFTLLLLEAGLLALAGVVTGMLLAHGLLALAAPWLAARYGLFLALQGPGLYDLALAAAVMLAALLVSLWPAWRAYRNSLSDGLSIRT